MYLPYLRGRQYELIALRELLQKGLIGNKILPIIEPIKISSTLIKTLDEFSKEERKIAIIHNPQVGSFFDDMNNAKDKAGYEWYLKVLKNEKIIKGHIINENSANEINKLLTLGNNKNELLVITNNQNYTNEYTNQFIEEYPKFTLIPDEGSFKRKVKVNRVIFDDKFNKKERNVDYYDIDDEIFSDDHLYFDEENYLGFSDYSVVGNAFSESGFAPYAVAIHIVYFDKDNVLRIKHFVSESNDDISNPANKFYEALEKLVEWQKEKRLDTFAMRKFVEHYENQTYPGLGTVKKLSIMHHIELVNKYLNKVS